MKTTVLNVTHHAVPPLTCEAAVSFKKLIAHLGNRVLGDEGMSRQIGETVLAELADSPGFLDPLPLDQIDRFSTQLHLVYNVLVSPMDQQESSIWGLCAPLGPFIFFGTDGFYQLLHESATSGLATGLIEEDDSFYKETVRIYSLILEKLYGFPNSKNNNPVLKLSDKKTGLAKYYRVDVDSRFVDILPKHKLPKIDCDLIKRTLHRKQGLDMLMDQLPLALFRFEGFAVITAQDVTEDYNLLELRTTILNRQKFDEEAYFLRIFDLLKTLVANPEVNFGMMPHLKVNDKVILGHNAFVHSKFMNSAVQKELGEQACTAFVNDYLQEPQEIIVPCLSESTEDHPLLNAIKRQGVQSCALLPIYQDNAICGVLEVYSERGSHVSVDLINRLDPALPLLGRICEGLIMDFQREIDQIVRDKFTSIQPVVNWRFREAAWHHLKGISSKSGQVLSEPVEFKNVFALYGAVDIRNASFQRNTALRIDLNRQFDKLIEIFSALRSIKGIFIADEIIFKCRNMQIWINDQTTYLNELLINDFLDTEVHPALLHFLRSSAAETHTRVGRDVGKKSLDDEQKTIAAIEEYFFFADPKIGSGYAQRRAVESSLQTIDVAINEQLDLFRDEIHRFYPSYFEKFRTDGIGYDIYLGQSMCPQRTYMDFYLKNIRLAQLKSMAAIARTTHSLLATLDLKLQTSQLIFISSAPVDIAFRDDERRFGMQGTSNLRYQSLKEKIDGVRISGTSESLICPGKIAIAYMDNKSLDEYHGYIAFLQQEGILLRDLEHLALDQLPDIDELRALRVGVNLSWSGR